MSRWGRLASSYAITAGLFARLDRIAVALEGGAEHRLGDLAVALESFRAARAEGACFIDPSELVAEDIIGDDGIAFIEAANVLASAAAALIKEGSP